MKIPNNVEFENHCEEILRATLLSVLPEEGCALLLGNQKKKKEKPEEIFYQISLIWPCCNIWKPGIENFPESNNLSNREKCIPSRNNRFAIDPKEQLLAQKWARRKSLVVLGNAHSHPSNLSIPSKSDIAWHFSTSLMLIVSKNGDLRAWWIKNTQKKEPVEIPCKYQTQNL
tara:strand:- start:233 stop:748 length:516 start_codon:yes stop_codon:yes gene_type:complete